MDLIIQYLTNRSLFADPLEVKRLRWMASQYILMNGQLYKRSFSHRLLKCLKPMDADYALQEVYEEIYENHLEGKSLSYKVLRQGYYRSTMKKDATELVWRCESCQKYAKHMTSTSQPADINYCTMILRAVENRHTWSFLSDIWSEKIYSSCHWLLHQMGRSWTLDINHWK